MAKNNRNFRRITLKTVLTATGIVTPKGNDIRKTYQLPLEDLSAGGLRYASKFAIPLGTRLDLIFHLDDRKVGATVEVVRSQKTADGKYDIGCKFIGINRLDQESIIKYVTLSSVRDSQPSSFYSLAPEKRSANVPITCGNCRCADCGDKEACRACYKPNCGKRFCRMYVSNRQNFRP
ncbi:MAG: PilZ domain-containing protein [Negativicutes bacterium]|nr:PilZ domain-containing protein [Negativicutes bacterium]